MASATCGTGGGGCARQWPRISEVDFLNEFMNAEGHDSWAFAEDDFKDDTCRGGGGVVPTARLSL